MKFITSPVILASLSLATAVSAAVLPQRDIEVPTGLVQRQNVGSTITIGGAQYELIQDIPGPATESSFVAKEVSSGKVYYAKRPSTGDPPSPTFLQEIDYTRKASDILGTGLFAGSGSDLGYTWIVTASAPGAQIWYRWNANKGDFASRAACEADMEDAREVIIQQNEKLAQQGGFVHGRNVPSRWFVKMEGPIETAAPVDFGTVIDPPPASIQNLVNEQFVYNDDKWRSFVDMGFCV